MGSPFETLGLLPQLLQAIEQMGFTQPTPIQQEAIPALLAGRNVVGQAQTGTGKTAAFALPMLQQIQPGAGHIQALILAPTRELAVQVAEATERMARNTTLKVIPVYGGQSYDIQIRKIKRGVDVVVGTPGRMLDLIRQKMLDLSQVRYLVLDEADEMLEMGFIDDVESILSEITTERQVALFSATMPAAIRSLADRFISDPHEIRVNPTQMTVTETEQRYTRVGEQDKLEALCRFIEVENVKSALIFARTKARAQDIADSLIERGYPAESLHGDLSQARRETVLNRFRHRSITLLVATDVAARGLDIEDVSHVFNYDVPGDAEDYVHRIGRTGRAGRKGVAITFLHPRDRKRRGEIQAYTRMALREYPVPTIEQIQARRDERFTTHMYEMMLLEQGAAPGGERAVIDRMLEAGVELADIAAAAIRMARQSEGKLPAFDIDVPAENEKAPRARAAEYNREGYSQAGNRRSDRDTRDSGPSKTSRSPRERAGESTGRPVDKPAYREDERYASPKSSRPNERPERTPELRDPREQPFRSPKQFPDNGNYVRLRMNLGDRQGLRPSDVVGAIAGEVGIPGKAIGEIHIFRNHTFVDISEKHVRRVLQQSTGQYQLHGRPVTLTLAS